MTTVLFYVSGHGYGHAVRIGEVIRELRSLHPDWRLLVRTQAPQAMFPADVEFSSAEFDSGVVEQQAGVVVDTAATRDRLLALLGRWDAIVETEAAWVQENEVDLIVADIPPIAGSIAHAAGRRCIGIGNFTWDWIYEPYARDHLAQLEQGYAHMSTVLRLPFAQSDRWGHFREVIEVPLIARKAEGAAPLSDDGRVRVFVGSRAQVAEAAFARAQQEAPEFDFVLPPSGPGFTEVLTTCDLVVAKLGFSMVAECIAAGKPMLYPPREHFREETILQQQVPQQIPCLAIPLTEFYEGRWAPYLRALYAEPKRTTTMPTDGAKVCAQYIAGML